MQGQIKVLYNRKWQWGISFIVSILLFVLTFLTTDIIFSTNDDVRIMYALAGYNTGEPYPYHPFINLFLGWFVSGQYRLFPQIPWYGLFHVGSLFTGTVVIGKCFMKLAGRKSLPVYIPVMMHVFFYETILIATVVNMQFSTTAAILGIAAAALIYTLDFKGEKPAYIVADIIWSVLLLIVCFMIRSFTWYCIMCFYGLAVLFQLLKLLPLKHERNKKWILILGGSVLVTLICVVSVRFISLEMKKNVELNKEFEEYNNYRADFQDYRKRPDYDTNIDFYEKLGWRKNTYRAMLSLIFMDEEITTDNMKEITEEYENSDEKREAADFFDAGKDLFEDSRIAKTGSAVILTLSIMNLALCVKDKKRWRVKVIISLALWGFMLMFFVLSYGGRLPVRTFMVVTMPAAMILSLCFFTGITRKKIIKRKPFLITGMLVCIFIMLYNIRAVYFTDDCTKTQTTTAATLEQVQAFEEYAIKNMENVYVYDFSVATVQRNPFVVYPDNKPTNCIISGGSYTFSTLYYKQLELNGLQSLYWKDMLNEGVYFVSANKEYVELVKENITETTGKTVKYETIQVFAEDGIKIYRFYEDRVFENINSQSSFGI